MATKNLLLKSLIKIHSLMDTTTKTPRGTGALSKKRYKIICDQFAEIDDNVERRERMLKVIRDVMNFDPDASDYHIFKSKIKENESTYQKCKKDYYERHKEQINAKITERRRQARLQQQQQLQE